MRADMEESMAHRNRILIVLTVSLLASCVLATETAWAVDKSNRSGRWQFSLPFTYLTSSSWEGAGDSSIDLHSDVGFGVGFGYNFNEKTYLGGEISWTYVDYDANVRFDDPGTGTVSLGGELDASTVHFKGQYNFLPKSFTPFVGAGFGWTYIDTNIASGPAEGFCWWDPWWGYICDTWQPTYDDTAFSYGVNAGLRVEPTEQFFLEFKYNILWIDTEEGGNLDVDGAKFELGWMF